MGLAERECQVGQERLGLPGGEEERRTGVELGLKAPKKRKFQTYRDLQCPPQTLGKRRRRVCHSPYQPSSQAFSTLLDTILVWRPGYNHHESNAWADEKGSGGMEPREHPGDYATFIVRIRQDDVGRVSGAVERVRTEQKVELHGLETLSRVVASLLSTSTKGGT